MERSKKAQNGSFVFTVGQNDGCIIRYMTVYREGLVIDAEFTKPSISGEKEWELGEKGAVKLIVSEGGSWQEIMIDYCLKEGYINLTAITALYLTKSIISSIANQFFIRKGNMLQFLSTRSIHDDVSLNKERFVAIRIPKQ